MRRSQSVETVEDGGKLAQVIIIQFRQEATSKMRCAMKVQDHIGEGGPRRLGWMDRWMGESVVREFVCS